LLKFGVVYKKKKFIVLRIVRILFSEKI